jgi:large subunit ribosomal protein L9
MSKEVEVIFTKDEKGQFKMGQRKTVKLGYARNYLFPNNLAVMVSPENELYMVSVQKKVQVHQKDLKTSAEDIKSKIDGQTVTFVHKVHDDTKLYGSVSSQDIATEVNKEFEVTIDRYDIGLDQPIKMIGNYKLGISIHDDIKITVQVDVQAEPKKEDPKSKESKK